MALASLIVAPSPADDTPLVLAAFAAGLYWGGKRRVRPRSAAGRRAARRRAICFALALAVLVGALQEPLDSLADRWLWVHMLQHVLLISVAAPLLAIASPWGRLWRALPLGARRPMAGWLAHGRTAVPLRAAGRALSRPGPAWVLYSADLAAWHLPSAYDLTLRVQAVHDAEHACFLATGLVVWRLILAPERRRGAPDLPRRVALTLATMGSGWALALAMAFASRPWYRYYEHVAGGGLSALTDQHLAAGVMWVPASLPFAAAVFLLLYRWLVLGDAHAAGDERHVPVPARRRGGGPRGRRAGVASITGGSDG